MPSRPDPTDELRDLLRSERHATGPHPDPEQLVAYHERRLSPGEAEEVRAHLAACPDCTAQLLALAELFEMGAPHVEADRAPLAKVVPLRRSWGTAALGLAAALFAIVSLVQWRTIVQLRQPQANPPLVNLAPVGSTRQGAPVSELRLPAGARRVWVILNPLAEPDTSAYDVEVIAPDGEVVLRLDNLRRSEKDNFRLEIPRDVLSEGDHRILLWGRTPGGREASGEFSLRVLLDPAPRL